MGKSVLFSLLLLVLLLLCSADWAVARAPVILVPGLAGSVIKAKLTGTDVPHRWCSKKTKDFYTIWFSLEEVLPLQKDCLLAHLQFTFNHTSGEYYDAPGVLLDTNVDFGGTEGVSSLDPNPVLAAESGYYRKMIRYLRKELGYRDGVDLHGAPYDWRMAPDGWGQKGKFYDKLRTLIETTVTQNKEPAHLISHSLGGPALLGFLSKQNVEWIKKHVASFIPINAPFAGSVKQIKADVTGDPFGVPFIPDDYLRPVQSAAPSGSFLLPVGEMYSNSPVLSTPERTYRGTLEDMLEMLQELGLDQARDALLNMHKLEVNLEALMKKINPREIGIPVTHIITSSGVKTTSGFTLDKPLRKFLAQNGKMEETYGDGDGTVGIDSLNLGPQLWIKDHTNSTTNTQMGVHHFNLEGVSHFGMVSEQRVLDYIKKVIQDHDHANNVSNNSKDFQFELQDSVIETEVM